MMPTPSGADRLAELAVVVIARNEEDHIAACIEAALAAVDGVDCPEIVLVDSDSSDRTVDIAARYPISILRYRAERPTAAAGRRIGFAHVRARHVLFLDGDCCVEPGFVREALAVLADRSDAAVVYGARRDVTPASGTDVPILHPSLGGNALYRAEALDRVGSFHPFIVGEEEGELLGRLKAAGYRAVRVESMMITHYTEAVQTIDGFMQRYRRGLRSGTGQVLRLSIGQGLFWYHARRLNRYLMTLGFLLLGAVLAVGGLAAGTALPALAWGIAGGAAFLLLWAKRRNLRNALYIVADWVTVALSIGRGFLRAPPSPASFAPSLERLK
jgi:glycosyltransferase involved in cell wall biosynthesis